MSCNPINAFPPLVIGDSRPFSGSIKTSGVAQNLTGDTITLYVKEKLSDVTPLYTMVQDDTLTNDGLFSLEITNEASLTFPAKNLYVFVVWEDTSASTQLTIISERLLMIQGAFI